MSEKLKKVKNYIYAKQYNNRNRFRKLARHCTDRTNSLISSYNASITVKSSVRLCVVTTDTVEPGFRGFDDIGAPVFLFSSFLFFCCLFRSSHRHVEVFSRKVPLELSAPPVRSFPSNDRRKRFSSGRVISAHYPRR